MPRRMVELDVNSLEWALAVLRDNRFDVNRRGNMTSDWEKKYITTDAYLIGLIKKAKNK